MLILHWERPLDKKIEANHTIVTFYIDLQIEQMIPFVDAQ